MRSLPSGWNQLLTKLGFSRKRRKVHSQHNQLARRLRFESLERRELLSITVNTLVDERDGNIISDGDVSLRDAIELAPAGETIDFAPSLNGGTITLLSGGAFGQISFGKYLTIDASMLSNGITIDAGHQGFRIFNIIDTSAGSAPPLVTLKGLTLTGGDVSGDGGAINSEARLSVIDCILEDNNATNGGAIHLQVARESGATTLELLRLDNTTIDSNLAVSGGGASETPDCTILTLLALVGVFPPCPVRTRAL